MSDGIGMPEHPAPLPLPLSAPPVRRRGGSGVVMIVVAVLLGLCACVCVGVVLARVVAPLVTDIARTEVNDAIVFGAGRYLAVECLVDSGGSRSVYAVDLQDGVVRAAIGYDLMAAEPDAPVLWLVPATNDPYPGAEWRLSDGVDVPPRDLMQWDVAAEPSPARVTPVEWVPWVGDGGYSAFAEVDTGRGAWPSRLRFDRLDGSAPPAVAKLPEGFRTFAPVGWSRSGRLFALRELGGHDALGRPRGGIAILDASDGSLVATYEPESKSVAAAVWDVADEALWVVSQTPREANSFWEIDSVRVARQGASFVASGAISISGGRQMPWPIAATPDGPVIGLPGVGPVAVAAKGLKVLPSYGNDVVGILDDGDLLYLESGPISDRIVRVSDDAVEPTVVWTEEETRKWRWPE